jgi:hypothetical protein
VAVERVFVSLLIGVVNVVVLTQSEISLRKFTIVGNEFVDGFALRGQQLAEQLMVTCQEDPCPVSRAAQYLGTNLTSKLSPHLQ